MRRFAEIKDSLLQKLDGASPGEDVTLSGEEAQVARGLIRKYESYRDALDKAYTAYNAQGRQDERLREVAWILGFSGKKKADEENYLLGEYLALIENEGLSKESAVSTLVQQYDLTSYEAALKRLQRIAQEYKENLQERGYDDSFLRGIFPST
jgi:hypothetical protein